jgi:hypothetical protein
LVAEGSASTHTLPHTDAVSRWLLSAQKHAAWVAFQLFNRRGMGLGFLFEVHAGNMHPCVGGCRGQEPLYRQDSTATHSRQLAPFTHKQTKARGADVMTASNTQTGLDSVSCMMAPWNGSAGAMQTCDNNYSPGTERGAP